MVWTKESLDLMPSGNALKAEGISEMFTCLKVLLNIPFHTRFRDHQLEGDERADVQDVSNVREIIISLN